MKLRERSRFIAVLAATAALALVAVGCEGDDADQEGAAISTVIADAIMTEDPNLRCNELIAPDYVAEIYGDAEACVEADDELDELDDTEKPDEVIVSDIEIDGDTATASAEEVGGDSDGATGTITVTRVDEEWRVSELGIDYLRSQLSQFLASDHFDADDAPLDEPELRACLDERLQAFDDDAFRAIAYESMAAQDPNEDFMAAIVDCMRETGVTPGTGGDEAAPSGDAPNGSAAGTSDEEISVIRQQFEQGIVESALGDEVSQEQIECIVTELRETVTDDQIVEEVARGADDVSPELTAAVARAMANC